MTFIDAVNEACKQPTLIDALSWIAVWETERVIPEAHKFLNGDKERDSNGQGWSTCYKFLFTEVMNQYTINTLKGTNK